jgi:hypothetical protein
MEVAFIEYKVFCIYVKENTKNNNLNL